MKKNFLNQEDMNGKEWLNDYINILVESCEDFANFKLSYENAYFELRKNFKYIDEIIEYSNYMLISCLEFSFEQGLNDNLEHFRNPQASTFLDNDYDEALKEKELRKRPDYVRATIQRQKFVNLLPVHLIELYDIIVGYQVFLDTYIPKMAHYYGFVTGNKILQKSINEYEPDYELTKSYNEWLSVYLDLSLK